MGSLLRVYSGIFNSESAQKGLSKLAGREGEVIAAPCVTLIDDPFHCDNPEPRNFDAEGSPTHKKAVIENGVKTRYVKSFTVAGNFYELLKNIVALADNCRLPRAMGSTAFGAPSVLVDGLSVAGK